MVNRGPAGEAAGKALLTRRHRGWVPDQALAELLLAHCCLRGSVVVAAVAAAAGQAVWRGLVTQCVRGRQQGRKRRREMERRKGRRAVRGSRVAALGRSSWCLRITSELGMHGDGRMYIGDRRWSIWCWRLQPAAIAFVHMCAVISISLLHC
jgi:hypothetical protein